VRRDVTMLELVTAVTEHTGTEGEAIATVVHMVNSGAVRLCGIFLRGTHRPPRGRPAVAAGGLRPGSDGAVRTAGVYGVSGKAHPNLGCEVLAIVVDRAPSDRSR